MRESLSLRHLLLWCTCLDKFLASIYFVPNRLASSDARHVVCLSRSTGLKFPSFEGKFSFEWEKFTQERRQFFKKKKIKLNAIIDVSNDSCSSSKTDVENRSLIWKQEWTGNIVDDISLRILHCRGSKKVCRKEKINFYKLLSEAFEKSRDSNRANLTARLSR